MATTETAGSKEPEMKTIEFPPIKLKVEHRDDGSIILQSGQELGDYEPQVGVRFREAANTVPDRTFLAERVGGGDWRRITYAEARVQVDALSQALLDRGLSHDKPLMILSGNSIAHALLTLAAMQVGVPVVPVSAAYSLMSSDFAKVKAMFALVNPGMVYVEDRAKFAGVVSALDLNGVGLIARDNTDTDGQAESFAQLLLSRATDAVELAFGAVGPDTVCKYLFTSGSTGTPKAVINTQRMMCANQRMVALSQAENADEPPVLLDWLPWSHTYGGNHNLNYVFWHSGTMYIDAGKPIPGMIEETLRNLKEVSPTIYFGVPAGYAMMLPHLEADPDLARNFFRRLRMLGYGGAAMPSETRERLAALVKKTVSHGIPVITGWGSTETAPTATTVHWHDSIPGVIGLPLAGVSIKMTPVGDKMELRVNGPLVTPGYYQEPELTARAFDEEGYYKMGDAGRLADPDDPEKGILFDGRIAENFKLATGTWVAAGAVRLAALGATEPLLQDAIVTGHDEAFIGLLAWPNIGACRAVSGQPNMTLADAATDPKIVNTVRAQLEAYNRNHPGSSTRIARLVLLQTPPSLDAGEITDKGYINQSTGLRHRGELVSRMYSDSPSDEIIDL